MPLLKGIEDKFAGVSNQNINNDLAQPENDISDSYLEKRTIHEELTSPAVQAIRDYESKPEDVKGLSQEEIESKRVAKIKEEEAKALEDPWLDPIMAFAGGFGGTLKMGLSVGTKLLPTLFRSLVSGGAAAITEYPIGLTTEGVQEKIPALALPFSVITGMLSGVTVERAIEKGVMKVLTKGRAKPAKELIQESVKKVKANLEAGEVSDDITKEAQKALASEVDVLRETKAFKEAARLKAVIAAEPVEKLPKYAGNVNLNRIMDEGGDLKQLILANANELSPELKKARRGVQTWAKAEKGGEKYTLQDLLGRKTGQALNDQQIDSARSFLMASTENLNILKQKVLTGIATDENKVDLLKAFNLNAAIQSQVAGATAEAGRALSIFRKMATGGKLRAKQIQDILSRAEKGDLSPENLARLLEDLDDPTQISTFVRQARKATSFDMVLEAWINGLLSGPQTHAVNTLSNALVAVWQVPERVLASSIGKAMPGEAEIKSTEALHQAFGLVEGFKDGMKAFWKSIRTGEEPSQFTKMDLPRRRAISSLNFNVETGSLAARAVDLMGETIRLPTRFLGAEDAFFKGVGYRMELNARAFRQAANEGLAGKARAVRMREIINNPPDDIHMASTSAAEYQTFTKQLGEGGQAGMKFLNKFPALRLVVPFIRTPANIIKFAGERTPLALASKAVRAEISAGGARRDLALAKMSLGSMVMASMATMTAQGLITGGGPEDAKLRAIKRNTGWQPYSLKVGDTYYAFNRLEPLGMLFGIAADTTEIMGQANEKDSNELALAAVMAFTKNVTSKTWLRGASEAISALDDPERYGQRFLQNYARSLVPTGISQIERIGDPELRERYSDKGFWFESYNAIKERIPGWSKSLPPRRNMWGEPVVLGGGLGPDIVSPIYTSTVKHSPIDEELLRLKAGVGKPKKVQSIHGEAIALTPKEYDRLIVLMNTIKDPATGKTLKKTLDHLVTKDLQYRNLGDDRKEDMIRDYLLRAKSMAQEELYNESAELRKLIETLQIDRMIEQQQVATGR